MRHQVPQEIREIAAGMGDEKLDDDWNKPRAELHGSSLASLWHEAEQLRARVLDFIQAAKSGDMA